MKRVAVIFEEDIFNQKGTFLAKLERARHLALRPELEVDIYCIQVRYTWIERLLLGRRELDGVSERRLGRPKTLVFKGVTYQMLWADYSILDHFLFYKLVRLLKGYDAISAHGFEGAFVAREAKRRFGTPYLVSWHGSDIHTKPFKYPCIQDETADLMAGAAVNFFVSKALMDASERIGPGEKRVLYNGVDVVFHPYSEAERARLRKEYDVRDKRVVAYVGNLFPLKQADLLPEIFRRMSEPTIAFWIIGDGPLRKQMEAEAGKNVRFWGNVPHEKMPDLMNVMDLIVLPSREEGFGLVLAEALCCGARAVGSLTGGIPEVIGVDACVPLDGNKMLFAEHFAEKAKSILSATSANSFQRDAYDWAKIAQEEALSILRNCK